MAAFFSTVQLGLALALAIAGFLIVRRRPHHTRQQLVTAAAFGGGLGGAVVAAFAAAGGASLGDALPWAVFGLITGSLAGLLGVAAFALGNWLSRDP